MVRLQGISTPQESGLKVSVVVNGVPPSSQPGYALRSSSGTQNYTFTSVPTSAAWTQVAIHSDPNNVDYGVADLSAIQ